MKLSDQGLDLIKEFEGYLTKQSDGSCKAYQCQAGVWTCGWGCTEGVGPNTHWTAAEATAALAREMGKHEAAVVKALTVPVSQSQFDALVSFCYNCGPGALKSLVKPLNAGDARGTAAKFAEFNKFTDPVDRVKKVSRGLVRRRAREADVFAAEIEPEKPASMPQAVVTPKEPVPLWQKVTGVLGLTGGATQIPAPPEWLTASSANLTAWKGMLSDPFTIMAVVICTAAAALLALPKLLGGQS